MFLLLVLLIISLAYQVSQCLQLTLLDLVLDLPFLLVLILRVIILALLVLEYAGLVLIVLRLVVELAGCDSLVGVPVSLLLVGIQCPL